MNRRREVLQGDGMEGSIEYQAYCSEAKGSGGTISQKCVAHKSCVPTHEPLNHTIEMAQGFATEVSLFAVLRCY